MTSHAPKNYVCPICLGLQGSGDSATLIKDTDIIYKDDTVTALINSFTWGMAIGRVMIVPNKHYENLYDLPAAVGHRIFDASQKIALAMKRAFNCDGVTTRQNNEPAGDQHAFHYHLHVTPRFTGDTYNTATAADRRIVDAAERAVFAQQLKDCL